MSLSKALNEAFDYWCRHDDDVLPATVVYSQEVREYKARMKRFGKRFAGRESERFLERLHLIFEREKKGGLSSLDLRHLLD